MTPAMRRLAANAELVRPAPVVRRGEAVCGLCETCGHWCFGADPTHQCPPPWWAREGANADICTAPAAPAGAPPSRADERQLMIPGVQP